MAQAKGSTTKILVGIEPSYGSISTGFGENKKAVVIPYATFNVKNSENQIINPLIKGDRNPVKPARGNKNPSGTFSTLLTPFMYPLFAYTLGKRRVTDSYGGNISVTNNIYTKPTGAHTIVDDIEGYTTTGENSASVANETAPYIHTFSIGEIPSFTIEVQFSGLDTFQSRRFLGCCVNTMTIKIPQEGYIGLDLEIMAARETTDTSKMAGTNEITYTHTPYDAFELAGAHVMLGNSYSTAQAIGCIDSISEIRINNNLGDEGYVLGGSGIRKYLPAGVTTVNGTCKIWFSDTSGADSVSLLTDINNGIKKSIILTFIRGNTTLANPGTSSPKVGEPNNEAIQIILPELMFAATSPVIEGPTGVYFEGTFSAYYGNTTVDNLNSGIQIKVLNSNPPRL
jgi:hypothetical protein